MCHYHHLTRVEREKIMFFHAAHLHTYRNRGHIRNFQRNEKGPLYILTGVAGNVRYPGLWVDHALDQKVTPQPEREVVK